MNIAIDGPAGAGKSTIARRVAAELGSIYVDTGAMYRAMALYMIKNGVDAEDPAAIERTCENAEISIRYQDGMQHVYLNGEDVTGQLRTEEVGNMASKSSACRRVREKLVELQQKLAETTSVVMDGRDIGTVVLPKAELKIYLTASAHTRALRRFQELAEKAKESEDENAVLPDLAEIEKDIEERDYRDMHRENSPLMQAEDAVVVDSSDLTIEEVTNCILKLAAQRKHTS